MAAAAKKPAKAKAEADEDTASSKPKAKTRRPLTVNVFIDGEWYGPAWGNADKYPADGIDGRPDLFEA